MYFIDDLNMPYVDKYDTQSAIELARQMVDYRGWYVRGRCLPREEPSRGCRQLWPVLCPALPAEASTCQPVDRSCRRSTPLCHPVPRFDKQKILLKEIQNCQYAAAMNPTAGSFNITPRMQRHFVTFAVQVCALRRVGVAALLASIVGRHES